MKTQAYVSETDIEDEHWYRLRVGPFSTRAEAERVLEIALAKYPRAWLAINDEQTDLAAVEHAGVQAAAAEGPTDPPLPDDQRAQMLRDARTALEKHQYPEAVDLLSRLLRQPEYPGRADAQELLGLVRERAGQLAQAKAEYEAYLRRYPNGPGAARVRGRLQALAAGFTRSQIDRRVRGARGPSVDHGRQYRAHLPVRHATDSSRPAPPPPRPRSMPRWCMPICWFATAASATTSPPGSMRAIRKMC